MTTHDAECSSTVSERARGQRTRNGMHTLGRFVRTLREPTYDTLPVRDLPIAVRDGTTLLTDTYRPDGEAVTSADALPSLCARPEAPLHVRTSGHDNGGQP